MNMMSEMSYAWREKERKSVPLNVRGRVDSPELYNSHYRSFYVKYQWLKYGIPRNWISFNIVIIFEASLVQK